MDSKSSPFKISIVIPCYNVASYLDRCWNSLKAQTIGIDSLECIFVNDASTDDGATWDKLQEIETDAPDSVMLINLNANAGPGEARNIAISHATGEYLEFLDADDELRNDACELLYNIAKENDADIIQFNHIFIAGSQKRSSDSSTENKLYSIDSPEQRIPFLNATKVTYGCTNKLYKLALLRSAQVAFPPRVRYEEPLFVYPLFLYANRVYLLNEGLYMYYIREGSMITSMLGKNLLDHPNVQLMLLENCMQRKEVYPQFKDIIEIYFLWSFYCETISFAGENTDAVLPLEYFCNMQKICNSIFPNWKNNPHISMIPKGGIKLLESLAQTFNSQGELNSFISESKNLI
jgi:glycosyltransferase involved in cell wall biosynthesis